MRRLLLVMHLVLSACRAEEARRIRCDRPDGYKSAYRVDLRKVSINANCIVYSFPTESES